VYRRTVPETTRARRIALIALRGAALSILCFLLFEPVLNLRSTERLAPAVALLVDDSKSLTVQDGGVPRATTVRELLGSGEIDALDNRGELVPFVFAGSARRLEKRSPDSLRFAGGETDIGAALLAAQQQLAEKNLRAVVLVSDGNVTAGRNPLYAAEALGAPVYVIGVGDSTPKKDLLVARVLANAIAYVETRLPVDAIVRGSGLEAGTVQVTLSEGGSVVDRATVAVQAGGGEYPVSLSYTPKSEGVKKLTVDVAAVPGEATAKNNRSTFFVKALKSRMTIVLVAGAPSPDVSLIEQVLARDRNMALSMYVRKAGAAWYGNAPTQKTFDDADCILLVGYPTSASGSEALPLIRAAMERANRPLFLLLARDSDLPRLRAGLDAFLPFDVVQWRKEETQVFAEPAADARTHPVMATGIAPDVWAKLPPLFKTESSFKTRPGAQTLATMKINGIAFNEPVLLLRRINRSKVVAGTAYGFWRWQLAHDAGDGRVPDLLIANAIRWLTTREDDKRVRIAAAREFFDSGEPVELTGQVYDETYEPVDDAEVTVSVRGPAGEQTVVLTPFGAGRYAGRIDGGAEGDYTFSGAATRDGKELGRDNGRFSVGELNVEFLETALNNQALRALAARTGGRYFPAADIRGLADAVTSRGDFAPRELTEQRDIQLWNALGLLAAAVLLFAAEWYLRKQAGML
jgi:hypothetical protein